MRIHKTILTVLFLSLSSGYVNQNVPDVRAEDTPQNNPPEPEYVHVARDTFNVDTISYSHPRAIALKSQLDDEIYAKPDSLDPRNDYARLLEDIRTDMQEEILSLERK